QFSFNHAGWVAPMEDNFDVSAWPNVWSQWAAAALIFHRGDVSAAKNVYEQTLSDKDLYGPLDEDKPIADEPLLPLITKTQISFGKESITPDTASFLNSFLDKEKKEIKSETSELVWNYGKGVFKLNTDKTQAMIGFGGGAEVGLNDVVFSPKTNFCSLAVSSMDDRAIADSDYLLLTAAARIENKGQKYNDSKNQLKDVGAAPILVEGVSAKIKLNRAPSAVYALDINGKRLKQIIRSGKSFEIKAQDKAFFYEIIF
ncbi:MAG: hypothetical protein FD145_1610, partial [Candidatus Saganbacteria bacterium]